MFERKGYAHPTEAETRNLLNRVLDLNDVIKTLREKYGDKVTIVPRLEKEPASDDSFITVFVYGELVTSTLGMNSKFRKEDQ